VDRDVGFSRQLLSKAVSISILFAGFLIDFIARILQNTIMSLPRREPSCPNNNLGPAEFSAGQLRALAMLIGEVAILNPGTGEDLTTQEFKVLENLSFGETPRKISEIVHCMSARSVKRLYYKSIKEKLGARSMPHAVFRGFEEGVLLPSGKYADKGSLSSRRKDVLELLAAGAMTSEIAILLQISPITVGVHMHEIKKIYGTKQEEEIVRIGIETRDINVPLAA